MSERVEWRVVCADGTEQSYADEYADELRFALLLRADLDARDNGCGPHRVQSRTVTTSEWVDADAPA